MVRLVIWMFIGFGVFKFGLGLGLEVETRNVMNIYPLTLNSVANKRVMIQEVVLNSEY